MPPTDSGLLCGACSGTSCRIRPTSIPSRTFTKSSSHTWRQTRQNTSRQNTLRNLEVLGFRKKVRARPEDCEFLEEEAIRQEFRQRRVEPFEEDIEWLEGKHSYQDRISIGKKSLGGRPPRTTNDETQAEQRRERLVQHAATGKWGNKSVQTCIRVHPHRQT